MVDSLEMKSADRVAYTRGTPPHSGGVRSDGELERATALEGVCCGMTLPDERDVTVGAPGCQRCEITPAPLRGPGTVIFRFPHTHTLGKVLAYLARSPWRHSDHGGTVNVHVPSGSLAPLLSPIMGMLSPPEQRDTRALFRTDGELAQVSDFFQIEALPDFAAKASSDWLLDILRGRRLRSVFHPILRCASAGNGSTNGNGNGVYGYECLIRAEVEGETVMPGPMFEMARGAGLILQLDLAARRSAITVAAAHKLRHKVFINFAPNAIYNPYACLDSTVRMVDEGGFKREQVVFEIVEGERLPEAPLLKKIVDYYRENGFEVALDDVGAGFSSLSARLALRPDYVKLDMGLVRGVHKDPARALVARKLIETARELGMETVAEGVESEGELHWLQEQGADFVQGFLFARPGDPPPLLGS